MEYRITISKGIRDRFVRLGYERQTNCPTFRMWAFWPWRIPRLSIGIRVLGFYIIYQR